MKKAKQMKNRIISVMMILFMALALVIPSNTAAYAAEDAFATGTIFYDDNGVGSFKFAEGSGTGLYYGITIAFGTAAEHDERIVLPTASGFAKSSKSTATTTIVNMAGGKTPGEIAAYIKNVYFYNCSQNGQTINIKLTKETVDNVTMYCEATGHYYQFVPFTTVKTWLEAYDLASKMTFGGMNGYLATITSVQEDEFIYKASDGMVGWLGGTSMGLSSTSKYNKLNYNVSCFNTSGTAGKWYWACGPEIGQTFYGADKTSSTKTNLTRSSSETNNGSYYFNWNAGEPNKSNGTENCMTSLGFGNGYNTKSISQLVDMYAWNDISYNSNAGKSVGTYVKGEQSYVPRGFFVEFGDLTQGTSNSSSGGSLTVQQSAPKLVHQWNYLVDSTDNSILQVYCSYATTQCAYYGTALSHEDALELELDIADHAYNRNPVSDPAVANMDVLYAKTSATVSYQYYKVDTEGARTGGTLLTGKPKDVGFYYVKATITGRNKTGATDDTTTSSVTLVKDFKIFREDANYYEEDLNNLKSAEGKLIKKVTGPSASSNLHVVLTDQGDKVTLYKIGAVIYNTNNKDYDDMTWVAEVANWRANNDTYTGLAYASPLAMNDLSQTQWTAFFQALTAASTGVTSTNVNTKTPNSDPATYQVLSPVVLDVDGNNVSCKDITYANYSANASTKRIYATGDAANGYTVDFNDLPLGMYAVVGTSGSGSPYNVAVISIAPDHNGAWDSWFVDRDYTVYLKEAAPTIDKVIKDGAEKKTKDTVAIGDTVDFDIEIGMLTFYKDRVVLTDSASSTVKPYQLYFKDYMDDSLKMVIPNGTTNYGYTIKYQYSDGTTKEAELPNNLDPAITYYELAENGYTAKTGETDLGTLTAGNYSTYAYDESPNTSLYDTCKVIQKTATSLYTISQVTVDTETVTTINFNVNAIKAWQKANSKKIIGIHITYQAEVTDKVTINSEDNYNTAALYYEKNVTGSEVGNVQSKVHVYTYGMRLIKIDGDTADKESPTPLAGVIFNLYQETDTYVKHTTPAEGENPAVTKTTWKGDIFGNDTETITKATDDPEGTDGDRSKTLEAILADDAYYVYEETATATGKTIALDKTDTSEQVVYASGDTVYHIYRRIDVVSGNATTKATNITSVDSLSGVIVKGLNIGNYILKETVKLEGYNDLAEDIAFEIRKNVDGDTVGDLKFFKDMNNEVNETGILDLKVLNYKGLILPSTGGMGTLLFTILGILIMCMAITFILRRYTQNHK